MRYNKLSGALISVTLIALLSACGQAKQHSGELTAKPQVQGSAPEAAPPAKQPVQDTSKNMTIKIFFGDELGEKLIEQEAVISYKQDNDKYAAALAALSKAPDDKKIALLRGITIKSAVLNNQKLTVDLFIAPEARLGAGGEELLLQAMKKTLFQFLEIQTLDLLVDGKSVDSLMGHMELPHPINRS